MKIIIRIQLIYCTILIDGIIDQPYWWLIISPQSIKIPLVDRFINYFREENNNTTLKPGWAPFPGSQPQRKSWEEPCDSWVLWKSLGSWGGNFCVGFPCKHGHLTWSKPQNATINWDVKQDWLWWEDLQEIHGVLFPTKKIGVPKLRVSLQSILNGLPYGFVWK